MMPTCKMNETKLEVSENYEEADLSDVEDDVFVRSGGRNGYRTEYDIAKKPLMTPRKKVYGFDNIKNGGLHTQVRSSPPSLRVICMPMCYILIATFAMLGLVAVITFLTSYVSWPLSILNIWKKDTNGKESQEKFIPCDNIEVHDVWVKQFPKLLTESAFRLLDVNKDGVDDIIFGYATGADGYGVPDFVCDIYFNGQSPCFGGVLALDGQDGTELWRHWTAHEVFALNCNEDLNQDGIHDCLVGGRAGVFCSISGADGSLLWEFGVGPAKNPIMNIYTSQFIQDLNGDGVLDILAVHGGDPLAEPDSTSRLSGRLLIVSGKSGDVLQWVGTPDQKESYYSPQILTLSDGSDYVLFGTGGETNGGGLYVIALSDLYKGSIQNAKLIYKDEYKGIMVPPVITDVNGDKIDDIIMAMFNSSVIAFDGSSFQQIWNYTFPSSETYTTPTPGYFNEDNVPDFLVKYQYGPGFPIYFHAQTTVLDGVTGKPILENPIIDTIGSQASTPLIRFEGFGNDMFLYWSSNCKGFEGNSSQFSFIKGTNVHEQSRADFCKLRFSSKLINQLRAFNRVTGLPGSAIYDSDARSSTEYNATINTSQDGQIFLQMHPEMWQYFDQQYKPSGTGVDTSEMIPGYPASALLPGTGLNLAGQSISASDAGQYVPSYPGGASVYDLPSQPELTEDVKYPPFHAVRKHGKYTIPQSVMEAKVAGGMSNGNGLRDLNINVNRRTHHTGPVQKQQGNEQDDAWQNYYPNSVPDAGGGRGDKVKYSDGVVNDPYEKSGRGRYRYLPPTTDVDGVDEQVAADMTIGANEPYHHRWRKNPNLIENQQQHRKERVRRHIGPHDMDGIQRLISTGTLVQPLNSSDDGIDLVFATYWFYPAKTQAILPKDRECIQEKMSQEKQRFDERTLPTFYKPGTDLPPSFCEELDQQSYGQLEILHCDRDLCDPPGPIKFKIKDKKSQKRHKKPNSCVRKAQPLDKLLPFLKQFIQIKLPIIWILGLPLKSVAKLRRSWSIQFANRHKFAYVCMEDRIARWARLGKGQLKVGNRRLKGLNPIERAAIPLSSKLVEESSFKLSRDESMQLLMCALFENPGYRGYVIDGFPWNEEDCLEFESLLYPAAAGIYWMTSEWTVNKEVIPDAIQPLFFRRDVEYNEVKVEDACNHNGSKTLKITHCENLDRETTEAVNEVVLNYLDKYWEIFPRNVAPSMKDPLKQHRTCGPKMGSQQTKVAEYLKRVRKEKFRKLKERNRIVEGRNEQFRILGARPINLVSRVFIQGSTVSVARNTKKTSNNRLSPNESRNPTVDKSKRRRCCRKRNSKGHHSKSKKSHRSHHTHSKKHQSRNKSSKGRHHCCRSHKSGKHKHGKNVSKSRSPHRKNGLKLESHSHHHKQDLQPRPQHHEKQNAHSESNDKEKPPKLAHPFVHFDDMQHPKPLPHSTNSPNVGLNLKQKFSDPEKDPEFWGYESTRHIGKAPRVHVPRVYPLDLARNTDKKAQLREEAFKATTYIGDSVGLHSHNIPDPYNVVPRPRLSGPRNNKVVIKGSKIKLPTPVTPFTTEPVHGLRSLFSSDTAKIISKNQAEVGQLKTDRLVNKSARVEYEIYQNDFRIPTYRFDKEEPDEFPDYDIRKIVHYVPCLACCFKCKCCKKKTDPQQNELLDKLDTLAKAQATGGTNKKPTLKERFNRLLICLCGEENLDKNPPPPPPPKKTMKKDEDSEDDLKNFLIPPDYKTKQKEITH